jgi:hypothetical protein
MAEHDIDKLIASGRYNLALEDKRLKFTFGDDIDYQIVEGGRVQEDMTIPVKIRIGKPKRYKGWIADARLIPVEKSPCILMPNPAGEA